MSASSDWGRVRRLFQAALELPPDARDGFLAEACGRDESLHGEVRSLLAAHTAAGAFLESPAFRFEDAPPPRPAATLQAGDRLGRFAVTGALGAGGMGEVYRARDTQLGREVAIKLLPPALAADPQRLARFERESRVLAALKHPNIATIHSIEDVEGLRLLVLELVEGPTLAERITAGRVPLADVLAIARQLADALGAAHARGIVHRDLKPANVKLSPAGQVTLLDFGLAKALVEEDGAPTTVASTGLETTAGLILGTWGYMSPEQARGRPVDQRADIWAFGCVLFELLAGRPVFQGETPSDTLASVLQREPDWSGLPNGLPPALHGLLRRCLEKDPARRLSDIGGARLDIDEALRQAEAGVAVEAAPVNVTAVPSVFVPSRRPQWVRALRGIATPLLAGIVVAIALVAYDRWRPEGAIDSLAVLPFENRSSDPDAEYLGDEIAENLIGQMSRVPSLTVMARGTTARFKGAADPRVAGQALGVGAVLSGAVSKRGDRLIVAVELIDVESGARLWGEAYDRQFTELLHLQDAIVSEIATGLRLRLAEPSRRALLQPGTRNPAAYELVMRARHLLRSDTEDDDLQARQLFEQAAALDPGFVEAHLGVAATYLRSAAAGYEPPGEALQRAGVALDRVLALDPGNVRARAGTASLRYQRDWDWPSADREFRVLVTDPRLYQGVQHHAAAMYFLAIGRPEESAAIVKRALATDPGNLESRVMLCDFLAEAGRLDDALACHRSVADAAPTDARSLFGMAEIRRRRDDLPGAIAVLRSAYARSGDEVGARLLAAARTEEDYRAAELAVARARLDDLQALARERYVSPLDLARLHALVGAREPAFASLEQALAQRSPPLVFLKVDRAWDRVRDDPRFAAVVRRVGIP